MTISLTIYHNVQTIKSLHLKLQLYVSKHIVPIWTISSPLVCG